MSGSSVNKDNKATTQCGSSNSSSPQGSTNVDYLHGNVNSPDHRSYNLRMRGLQNLGNTCYMNGILQCLNSTPPLVDYLSQLHTFKNNGPLLKSFAKLLQNLSHSNDSSVSPNTFKGIIGDYAPKFRGYQQQDSHEFLTVFFEAMIEETIDSHGFSTISELFEGQMEYTIKCSHPGCSYKKIDTDPFMTLSLFIEDKNASPFSSEKYPNSFRIRLIDSKGLVQTDDISTLSFATLGSFQTEMKSKFDFDIYAMKINERNELVYEHSSSVPFSSIDDQMTIFYEIAKDNDQYTNIVLLFRDRNSSHSVFLHPPTIIPIRKDFPVHDLELKIKKYLRNLFGAEYYVDISSDNDSRLLSQFPYVKGVFNIRVDEKDLKKSERKLMDKPIQRDHGKQMTTFNNNHSSTTLEECLRNISVIESMSSNSVWFCSTCQQQRTASKQNRLVSISQVLIIQLKRFNFNSPSPFKKVERLVQYPLVLDMNQFLPTPSHGQSSLLLYDLIGVCLHSETLAGGHTTAYAKHSVTHQWYFCNDSQVCRVLEDDVINKHVRDAYILFYLRRPKN